MNFFIIQRPGIGRRFVVPLFNHRPLSLEATGRIKRTIMRIQLCTLIILITCMHVSATGYGQTITLSEKNASLSTLFEKINKQSGYTFWYNLDLVQKVKPITVNLNGVSVNQAMQQLLVNQPLSYKIVDKTIVISPVSKNTVTVIVTEDIIVEGKVTGADGVGLPGATVRLKGTSRSLMTRNDGTFTFYVVPVGGILQVSYLGYLTREVKVSKDLKTISLEPDNNDLNEVTVSNGYQTLDPRTLTSSISSVKAKDILVPGIFSIDQALEGRVPGLIFMNNSGEIGATPKIRIRGTSTVLGNHEPIWVVDGVVVNDPVNIDPSTINDLDFVNRLGNSISGLKPFDIESIDVLKDASATALYGVRAANGVIVITTKKGHAGPPTINFSTATTFTRRPRYSDGNINVMNSRDRVDYSRDLISNNVAYPNNLNYVGYEGALNDLYHNTITYPQFQEQVSALETRNTDWLGLITQDAISTQNDLSISGGTDKMRYFASVGAANQTGSVKGDRINQYTAFVKLNSNLSDKLTWDMSFRANVAKKNFVATDVNAVDYAYNASRALSAYNPDGSLSYYNKYSGYYYNYNILNEISNSRDITNQSGINLNNTFAYKFSPDFRASFLFSYALNNTDQEISHTENTFYAANLRLSNYGVKPDGALTLMPFGGERKSSITRNYNYLLRPQVDYNKTFGKNEQHLIVATLGGELSSTKYDGTEFVNRGILSERGNTIAPVNPVDYPNYAIWAFNNPTVYKDQLTNLLSGYFTTSYTFRNRYTLNFNTRTDYSNNFGSRSNEKFLPSYSFSGRWDMAQDFFKKSKTVNMLALRTSYGIQGNMLANQTPELIMKTGAVDPVTGEYTSNIAFYANPNLKWEKTAQFNGSLDFSLFNNKLNGYFTYYYKKTSNAFVNANVSDVNGLTSYVVNSGTIVNQGIEVALNITPINNAANGKGFSWRFDPQIGQAINSLLNSKSINQASTNKNTYTNYLDGKQVLDGHSINSFYSYQFAGLNGLNGAPLFRNDENTPANILKLQGLTQDQIYQYVMVPTGNRVPTLQGGLNNSFTYNRFSLGINLSYSFGARVRLMRLYENLYNGNSSISTAAAAPESNVNAELLNRWRRPGDEAFTTVPGILNAADFAASRGHFSTGQRYEYAVNIWQMYDNSDLRTASGNFVKIRTWSLRYALSDAFCKRAGLKLASISLAGTNLYTFASKKLNGQDPEQTGFSDSVQLSTRPTFSMGIDISL